MLARAVSSMSLAGDLAGAQAALLSLNRLLGVVAAPAAYAPPVPTEGSRNRGNGQQGGGG